MKAIISGQRGMALIEEGGSWFSISASEPSVRTPRKPQDLPFLFSDGYDIQYVDKNEDEIVVILCDAFVQNRMLTCLLRLCDETLNDNVRVSASITLESDHEHHPSVCRQLEGLLYSEPFPVEFDGARRICRASKVPLTAMFLERLEVNQSEVKRVSDAWTEVSSDCFGSYEERHHFKRECQRHLVFRELVLALHAGAGPGFILSSPLVELRQFANSRKVLSAWVDNLAPTQRPKAAAVTVPVPVAAPKTLPPSRMRATEPIDIENTASPAIAAIGLSKFYGPFVATKDVSFEVPRGQVAAFLGPNGAGKSTTMKMLTGYLAPTEGSATIGGHNVQSDRIAASEMLGYLPENGPLYEEMTPKGLLSYLGAARGMFADDLQSRMEFVAVRCALKSVWSKPISKLSKVFRQRVGMAQALLHDPEVLILDEPTSGLDPNQVHGVRDLITSLAETKTILLSTHILREVQAVCSRVIVINQGRVVFDGPTAELHGDGPDLDSPFRKWMQESGVVG